MSTSSAITCHRSTTTCLLTYANQNRKQGYFDDVIIKTANNQNISANRMVLSCYSKCFEAMFNSEMKERFQKSVDVKGVDGKALEILIDYIYTGEISINSENMMEILSGADYLQLDDVKEFCFELMEKELSTENCCNILHMTEIYSCKTVKYKVCKFISDNYGYLIQTDDFKNLQKGDLLQCLLNLREYPEKQQIICESILVWIKHDKEARNKEFVDLLRLVDFKQLSLNYLTDIISNDLVRQDNDSLKLINDQLMNLLKSKNFSEIQADTKILSIGGRDHPTKISEVYNLSDQISVVYPDLQMPLTRHCSIIKDEFIYCIGGQFNNLACNQVTRMNLNKQVLEWEKMASMKNKRGSFGAAVFKNGLVAAGGHEIKEDGNEVELNSTEAYSFEKDKWEFTAPLNTKRDGNKLVVCDGSLFALGGHDGTNALSSVERLDDIDDEWHNVAPMIFARSQFGAVSYEDFIYVIGGIYHDPHRCDVLHTVEKYNPRSNTWTLSRNLNIPRYDLSACLFQNQIVVIGGRSELGTAGSIEIFTSRFDKWLTEKNKYKEIHVHSLIVL